MKRLTYIHFFYITFRMTLLTNQKCIKLFRKPTSVRLLTTYGRSCIFSFVLIIGMFSTIYMGIPVISVHRRTAHITEQSIATVHLL